MSTPGSNDPGRRIRYRPSIEGLEERCLCALGFTPIALASDVPGVARVLDPNLVNPWGLAFSPTGPFWFADNGSGVSDLLDGRGQPLPLVVTIPSAATPTGTVFNGGPGFVITANGVAAPSRFLFAGDDGTISGWSALVDPTRAVLAVDHSSAGSVYKGLALATDAGQSMLYASDFAHGTIDVFNQDFQEVTRPGSFRDLDLPAGFAPFNIQNLNGLLFVTYAQQDGARHDDVPGAGHGFLDVYDTEGHLLRRFASQGVLNSPWGIALAPADFGPWGGALLVGNNGDGRVNTFDLASGAFLGALTDDKGVPLAIPNLWALTFGNGHAGGDADTLFFTAGVGYETHGLFGAIQAPARHGRDTAGSGAFDPNAPDEPGDYPLPPRGGPALRATSDDRLIIVADLLPLREASLALAPILSLPSELGARIAEAGPAARTIGGPLAVATSADGASNEAVPLRTFLELNTSSERLAVRSDTVAAPHLLAARDVEARELLTETSVEPLEASSSAAEVSAARSTLDRAPAEAAGDGAVSEPPLEARSDSPWRKWGTFLLVLCGPLLWGCWRLPPMVTRQRRLAAEMGVNGAGPAAHRPRSTSHRPSPGRAGHRR